MTVDGLNKKFGRPGAVKFVPGQGSLAKIILTSPAGTGEVYLLGAHVTSYVPAGGRDVLWTSAQSRFLPGQPIRGGVPICFPWFSMHPDHKDLPMHGFVRLTEWSVVETGLADGVAYAKLAIESDAEMAKAFDRRFKAEMTVSVGPVIELTLAATNIDSKPLRITEAFHTYFAVGDIRQARILGLGGSICDKNDGSARQTMPDEPLTIGGFINSVFINQRSACELIDPAWARTIRIEKSGSNSAIIWNPGPEFAVKMDDFPDSAWPEMVCIESGNIRDDATTLAPAQKHEMRVRLSARNSA